MRLVTSKSHVNAFNTVTGMEPEVREEQSHQEIEEEAAVRYSSLRQAMKEQYPNVPTGEREVHAEEVSDQDHIVKRASKLLKDHLAKLIGRGGYTISLDEFRRTASHNSPSDDEVLTDKAIMVFAVKFMVPGSNNLRTGKFVVEHDEDADTRLTVGSVFFDSYDNEYKLSAKAVEAFLAGEKDEMRNVEQPIAYFNADADCYDVVEASGTHVIASRLREAGFDVSEQYVDACHDPKVFGRMCYMVDVPLNRADEFRKVAAMSNEEWFNRGSSANKFPTPDLNKGAEWVDRAKERTGYDKLDMDKKWVDRAEERGPENAYPTEKAQLASDAMKKVSAAKNDVQKALADLKDLCK